jgi:hypothetical protein
LSFAEGWRLNGRKKFAVSPLRKSEFVLYVFVLEKSGSPKTEAKGMRLMHFLGTVREEGKFFIPIGHNSLKRHDSEK